MKKFLEVEYDDPSMVAVVSGKTGEVVLKSTRAGQIDFACQKPGRYDAGMKAAVALAAGKASPKELAMAATSSNLQRRSWLALPLLLAVPAAWARPGGNAVVVDVWKSPTCGCCKDWVTHMEANGFKVRTHDSGNTAVRQHLGMPVRFGSCHTASVDGYVVEGHVPAREIRRLLKERPAAVGLAVPAMPVGSPGMDGPAYGERKDPYDVLLVAKDGSATTYQRY